MQYHNDMQSERKRKYSENKAKSKPKKVQPLFVHSLLLFPLPQILDAREVYGGTQDTLIRSKWL